MSARVATPESALREARETIAVGSKSFAFASRLFTPETRDCAAVVYAWCRRADDAVDHAPPAEQAPAVARLRAELDAVYGEGELDAPVLAAFRDVVRACAIPRTYPEELIAGMEMDAQGARYDEMLDLYRYCYRAAGTVGLMMSHVMGVREESVLRQAAHMGIAMQITNICRDVLEDWELGRIYIPRALLVRCGAGALEDALHAAAPALDPQPPSPEERRPPPFPAWAREPVALAVAELLAEAERFYRSGDRGLWALPWRCALAVRAARGVYSSIGSQVARTGCDVTAGRAIVPGWKKGVLGARAAGRGVLELPARAVRRIRGTRAPHVPQISLEFPDGVLPV